MLNCFLTILLSDAQAEDTKAQITDNSMDIRLASKYASDEISKIHARYDAEEDLIQNQINDLDSNSDEYDDLKAELKELKEREDAEVARVEEKLADYQNQKEMENANLETQLEHIEKNKESFQEGLQKHIESSFGYFQN